MQVHTSSVKEQCLPPLQYLDRKWAACLIDGRSISDSRIIRVCWFMKAAKKIACGIQAVGKD